MRLTLRTLLAYLDDVLDPAAAKDIGHRVNENSAAREQVERIREVLRRRRIGAPAIAGPGSGPDPNLVSEYLDNSLSSEGIAELEKLCLESDVHLAEVAASHQILTLILGEPVEVSPGLRERMYALGHIPDSRDQAAAAAAPRPARTPPPAVAPGPRPQVPDYLKRSPWGPRLSVAALVALVLAWAVWIYYDPSLHHTGGDSLASNDSTPSAPEFEGPGPVPAAVVAAPVVAPSEGADLGTAEPLPRPVGKANGELAAVTPGSEPVPVPMPPASPPAVPLVPAPAATPPAPPSTQPPVKDAGTSTPAATSPPASPAAPMPPGPMVPAPAPPTPMPPVPMPPVAPVVPANPFPATLYASSDGVLLLQRDADWTVLPRRSAVHALETFACPEPFEAQFLVENGRLDVRLMGDTIVRLLPGVKNSSLGLAVLRGRVSLGRTTVDVDKPIVVDLLIQGRSVTTTFKEGNTLLGVDVIPQQPQGRAEPIPPMPPGGLTVVRGEVQIEIGGNPSFALRAEGGEIDWTRLFLGDKQGTLKALPGWLSPEGIKVTPTHKQFARSFEKEFALDRGVSQSIPAVAKSDIARMAEAAVHTLSLTDNYPELVRALQSKHEEARFAAILGLREWLAVDPQRETLLTEEAAKVFPDADVPYVVTLLWGFAPGSARDPQVSRLLVDLLSHEDIAIRELAFFHVLQMTAKTYSYKPILPKGQRDSAIARWEEHLKKYGALMPVEK